MLADMMLFARPPQMRPEPVDLVQLAIKVLAELADEAAEQETILDGPLDLDPVLIDADPVQLHVALRALCINSLEALGRGGNIQIGILRNGDTQFAEITVTDDGPGISPEIANKIFDPFFSGREAGRGLGFGLSKCWRIVMLHGGKVTVQSQPGHGATFTILLPARIHHASKFPISTSRSQ